MRHRRPPRPAAGLLEGPLPTGSPWLPEEMNALAIALSVPLFFAAIGIELAYSRAARLPVYRTTDSIGSLSCGVVQQATSIFAKAIILGSYAVIVDALPYAPPLGDLFTPSSVLGWIVLMLLVDHQYYWFHRASHRVNVFWAAHVVHHQSEEYNLSTALRQSALQGFVSALFYWPIALLGVPLSMFIGAITANTLYQFWIHTRLVRRLGPLELVLNTPSHHRVHHGIDPQYIDKNHAGILIVWDRLYGTFVEETVEPSYGTVKPLRSYNPLWANVDAWARIAHLVAASTTLREKLWAPFAPPEWQPSALGGVVTIPTVDRRARELYEAPTSGSIRGYVVAQFALTGLVLVGVLVLSETRSALELTPLIAWVCASTAGFGAVFEDKRWALPLELGRHAALPIVVWLSQDALSSLFSAPFVLAAALAAGASVVHLLAARRAPRTVLTVHSFPVQEGPR